MLASLCAVALTVGASVSAQVAESLNRYPARKNEWLAIVPKKAGLERTATEFLLAYMPLDDLRNLPTAKVTEAVTLSVKVRGATSWGSRIPLDIFLNGVVPYASVTEPRRSMRAEFQKKYLPLIVEAKTPGEAALIVNQLLFAQYKVTYNTRRLRTDQSAPETIAQGMATCTGLSIMLVDALRSVGVPARLAGIAAWPGRGGNHTWVEVWDRGDWHFIGAAEPDPKGLDHAWFAEDASKAIESQTEHAIFATSFKPTGEYFPLVWNPDYHQPAENVTRRYRRDGASEAPRLMVDFKKDGRKIEGIVQVWEVETGALVFQGRSLGIHSDINLHVMTRVQPGRRYLITADYGKERLSAWAEPKADTVVRFDLAKPQSVDIAPLLEARFKAGEDGAGFAKLLALFPATAQNQALAWQACKASPDAKLKAEFDAKTVSTSERTSPYLWRMVGEKPKEGWGLVIAMHGGGGAPKDVNDGEWKHMFERYYKDHPEAGGYIYLALRAPNDAWNGFYDDAICPLVERLILQFVKYADVDPNQVYACGASHGGYGTFVIGPKVPYRFAALHPAASAGTDGETEGVNLRNVRFTWAIGETDTAYGRHDRCLDFAKKWEAWQKEYGGFDGGLEEVKGAGHLINRFEENKTAELRKYRRNPFPTRVLWAQTDDVLHRFYWLEALSPQQGGWIDAKVEKNEITLTTKNQGKLALWLNPALVDLTKPVVVVRDGRKTVVKPTESLATYCDGLAATGDPSLSGTVRIVVD